MEASSIRISTPVPGPKSQKIMDDVRSQTPAGVSHLTPIAIAEAQGAVLTDVDGNTYIDFTGGIGAMNTGHGVPEIVEAINDQARRYLHLCFLVTPYEPYVELARLLNEITPGAFAKKTVLFNSGAEAVDNAVKIARFYTGRSAIVTLERGFHGRTIGALSLTGQVKPYKYGLGPFVPDVHWLPSPYEYRCDACSESTCQFHSAEYLNEMFRSQVAATDVAAVVVEPVLGEGGFIVPRVEYLQGIKEICHQHGVLFIADEIQTGFARTGRVFGIEHFGIEPDLILTAKSMSGGTPLSAVTGRAEIMDSLPVGSLGGTYGGNPLACRAAIAAIKVMQRDRLAERAAEIGRRLHEAFDALQRQHDVIGDVRGLGAMLAMEFVTDRVTKTPATQFTADVVRRCYERGLIVMKAGADGNVIRTLMPLVISDEQLDEGLGVLRSVLQELTGAGVPS